MVRGELEIPDRKTSSFVKDLYLTGLASVAILLIAIQGDSLLLSYGAGFLGGLVVGVGLYDTILRRKLAEGGDDAST